VGLKGGAAPSGLAKTIGFAGPERCPISANLMIPVLSEGASAPT